MRRKDDDLELMDSVQELLVKVKQMGPKSTVKASNKSDTNHDGSLDNPIEPLVLVERLDLDLTDLLWNVLNKVESLDELKKAWEYIFQVFDKEEIRPYVSALINYYFLTGFQSLIIFSSLSIIVLISKIRRNLLE